MMNGRVFSFSSLFRKGSIVILAFFLFTGLLMGSRLSEALDPSILPMMRASAMQSVSIVSMLSVLLLPFLLSAFFHSTCTAWLIIPICFLKGLCFGFCQTLICSSFAGAGWLVYFLLMFSDILTLPVLIFFWISCLDRAGHTLKRLLFCVAAVLFIVTVDCQFITPYWISLLI